MPMTVRCRLIPLLVAVLVIQGLVGAVPHTHRPEMAAEGPAPDAVGAVAFNCVTDESHHCLACSVHAPVVEQAAEFGIATGLSSTISVAIDGESSEPLFLLTSASPRGPPRVV